MNPTLRAARRALIQHAARRATAPISRRRKAATHAAHVAILMEVWAAKSPAARAEFHDRAGHLLIAGYMSDERAAVVREFYARTA